MSKRKPSRKKVVVSTRKEETPARRAAQRPRPRRRPQEDTRLPLLFGRENYIIMGIGAALIALGLLLMSGGRMPDPEIWDPDLIYSFRRTVLAPLCIIAGLVLQVVAIFRRSKTEDL